MVGDVSCGLTFITLFSYYLWVFIWGICVGPYPIRGVGMLEWKGIELLLTSCHGPDK